jgi:hypothetical protein
MGALFPVLKLVWGIVAAALLLHVLAGIVPGHLLRGPEEQVMALLARYFVTQSEVVLVAVGLLTLTLWSGLAQLWERRAQVKGQVEAESAIRQGFQVREHVIGGRGRRRSRRQAAPEVDPAEVQHFKQLVDENRRLRRVVADLLHLRSSASREPEEREGQAKPSG